MHCNMYKHCNNFTIYTLTSTSTSSSTSNRRFRLTTSHLIANPLCGRGDGHTSRLRDADDTANAEAGLVQELRHLWLVRLDEYK